MILDILINRHLGCLSRTSDNIMRLNPISRLTKFFEFRRSELLVRVLLNFAVNQITWLNRFWLLEAQEVSEWRIRSIVIILLIKDMIEHANLVRIEVSRHFTNRSTNSYRDCRSLSTLRKHTLILQASASFVLCAHVATNFLLSSPQSIAIGIRLRDIDASLLECNLNFSARNIQSHTLILNLFAR